jgi:Ras-related protein Rab-7A
MKNNYGADLKIIVIGNSGTGKTSFVNKWTKNTFHETYKATIVSEFGYKIINLNNIIYRIQLWDLAGQDKNTCITKIFCKDAHGAIIVSDYTNKNSLLETIQWKKCIDENSKFIDGSDMPIILIENKIDLLTDGSDEGEKELKEFANKNKFIESFRTSAKKGININDSMEFLIKHIVKKIEAMGTDNVRRSEGKNNNIKLNEKKSNESKKKNCC